MKELNELYEQWVNSKAEANRLQKIASHAHVEADLAKQEFLDAMARTNGHEEHFEKTAAADMKAAKDSIKKMF